jgi:hypothetical protein
MRIAAFGALIAAMLALGCQQREAPEIALKRATAEFRRGQIANLKTLVAQAENGELVTSDQIAIGISEDLVKTFVNASLPREIVVAQRLRVRVESAEALFRGSKAALLLQTRASSVDVPDAYATIEMAGSLESFKLDDGKLTTRVALNHFAVKESSIGDLAANALDNLVRANLETIEQAIPPIEIPVQLEQSIKIGGLTDGAVVANPGALPLDISVSQVLPMNQRLWVLLKAKAGPWQTVADGSPKAAAAVAK